MATISAFKSQLQGGGARPNQFRVILTFPSFVGGIGASAGNSAQFLCRAAQLPQSSVESVPVPFRGRPVFLAGERTFIPWNITVLNETNFLIRNALETWSNGIQNYASTNGITRGSDYQRDLIVHQLDRNDTIIKSYKFYDAWPSLVGEIQLSFEQNNAIEEFPVEFTYNYFVPQDI